MALFSVHIQVCVLWKASLLQHWSWIQTSALKLYTYTPHVGMCMLVWLVDVESGHFEHTLSLPRLHTFSPVQSYIFFNFATIALVCFNYLGLMG